MSMSYFIFLLNSNPFADRMEPYEVFPHVAHTWKRDVMNTGCDNFQRLHLNGRIWFEKRFEEWISNDIHLECITNSSQLLLRLHKLTKGWMWNSSNISSFQESNRFEIHNFRYPNPSTPKMSKILWRKDTTDNIYAYVCSSAYMSNGKY